MLNNHHVTKVLTTTKNYNYVTWWLLSIYRDDHFENMYISNYLHIHRKQINAICQLYFNKPGKKCYLRKYAKRENRKKRQRFYYENSNKYLYF